MAGHQRGMGLARMEADTGTAGSKEHTVAGSHMVGDTGGNGGHSGCMDKEVAVHRKVACRMGTYSRADTVRHAEEAGHQQRTAAAAVVVVVAQADIHEPVGGDGRAGEPGALRAYYSTTPAHWHAQDLVRLPLGPSLSVSSWEAQPRFRLELLSKRSPRLRRSGRVQMTQVRCED